MENLLLHFNSVNLICNTVICRKFPSVLFFENKNYEFRFQVTFYNCANINYANQEKVILQIFFYYEGIDGRERLHTVYTMMITLIRPASYLKREQRIWLSKENKKNGPPDGCKIEFQDTFTKYIFFYFCAISCAFGFKFVKNCKKTQNFMLISSTLKRF